MGTEAPALTLASLHGSGHALDTKYVLEKLRTLLGVNSKSTSWAEKEPQGHPFALRWEQFRQVIWGRDSMGVRGHPVPPTHPLWSQEAHSKVAAPVSVTCALGVSAGSLAPRLPALPAPESPQCYDADGNSSAVPVTRNQLETRPQCYDTEGGISMGICAVQGGITSVLEDFNINGEIVNSEKNKVHDSAPALREGQPESQGSFTSGSCILGSPATPGREQTPEQTPHALLNFLLSSQWTPKSF